MRICAPWLLFSILLGLCGADNSQPTQAPALPPAATSGASASEAAQAELAYQPGAFPQRERRVPLAPPYRIPATDRYDRPIILAEAEDAAGAHYQAYVTRFNMPGLISARDIYLAVDVAGDGEYEEVLHTGLKDFQDFRLYTDSYAPGDPAHSLALEVGGDAVRITHHPTLTLADGEENLSENQYARSELVEESIKAGPQLSILSLTELRRDSDGDGLTDVIEKQLLIDPYNPDTDGDGIEDYYDPEPNVDPASMGRLERGIARALSYARQQCINEQIMDDSAPVHPWEALYLEIEGAGDVAYAHYDRPHSFGVSISSAADKQNFRRLVGIEYGDFARISVVDLSHAQSDKVVEDRDYSSPEAWAQRPDTPADCQYVILMDYPSFTDCVYLVDISGELYPVKWWGAGG